MANRVEKAIAATKAQIDGRIAQGLTTKEAVEDTRKAFDMEFDEYCKFQELKSLAVANGELTLDEGMLVYHYMGETPSVFNNQPVEVKYALTILYHKLLKQRMGI
jgi:hypothetical protein